MKLNRKSVVDPSQRTHEGAVASRIAPIDELRRTVLACLLWEDSFYESGADAAARIADLVPKCSPSLVAELAIQARGPWRLRHAPLMLVRELARDAKRCESGLISRTLRQVIQRPDELTEFLSIYWKDGRVPLSKQVKVGLATAFTKFDAYQLGKYNRDAAVRLRDVLFLVHAKPKDAEQEAVWKRLVDGTLESPDTWEVALSAGKDKRETFERLIREDNLGYMALLRNLRNMREAGVDEALVFGALSSGAAKSKALPFRYLAAARAVPAWERPIDAAMQSAMASMPRLGGQTVLLVDGSGSMSSALSQKSDLNRMDAAKALAILVNGVCDDARVYRFNDVATSVPARHGMALADALGGPSGGTDIGAAVRLATTQCPSAVRTIVITDEQSATPVGAPAGKGYMVNVASYQRGIGYGQWTHITGFSEALVQYIIESER